MSAPSRIAVLGGGITGLTTAFYLSKLLPRTSRIVVYEKEKRFGGWLQSRRVPASSAWQGKERHGELVFEAGPRTIRPAGLAGIMTLDLVRDLGLLDKVIAVPKTDPSAKNRFVYYRRRLNKLPSSLPGLLSSLHLPALRSAPVALLRDIFTPRPRRSREEWHSGDEHVHTFFARHFGEAIAGNLVSAMIHGIYAGDSRHLSVRALFPSLWEMERRSGSLLRAILRRTPSEAERVDEAEAVRLKERLPPEVVDASVWGLAGGLSTLTDAMITKLRAAENVELRSGFRIERLEATDGGFTMASQEGENVDFSHAVSALPASRLSALAKSLELPHLTYNPSVTVAVVNLAYAFPDPSKRLLPVQGFGYLIPQSVRPSENPHHALGVIFDSDAIPTLDTVPGFTKLSVLLGGHHWASPSREVPTSEELARHARHVVRHHLGIADEPSHCYISIQRSCIPQYRVGHLNRMRDLHEILRERCRGRLSLVGPSYSGVGVNDCVRSARETAHRLAEGGEATGLERMAAMLE